MNGQDLMLGLQALEPETIYEAEFGTFARRPVRRWTLIAALIGLMLLVLGCAWYRLHIRDLQIATAPMIVPEFDQDGQFLGPRQENSLVLTLSGWKDTPNYLADLEWYEYLQRHDPQGIVCRSMTVLGTLPEFSSEYDGYYVYADAMIAKVDEIAEKYDLKLMGPLCSFEDEAEFHAAVGADSIFTSIDYTADGGLCYESGCFLLNFDLKLPDQTLDGVYYYMKKDCFTAKLYLLGDQEWDCRPYRTAAGDEIMIARSPLDSRCWLICNTDDAMVSVMLEPSRQADHPGLSNDLLEQLADHISFQPKTNESKPYAAAPCRITLYEAVTDGQTGWIRLRLEADALTELPIHAGTIRLYSEGDSLTVPVSQSYDPVSRELTLAVFAPLTPGAPWNLELQNLTAELWDAPAFRWAPVWKSHGCWSFDVTFVEGDSPGGSPWS